VQPLPPGTAKLLPAGSKLVFQVHYTPIGSEQFDQSKIGLVFIDREDVTHRAISTSALTNRFAIPPGESNHEVQANSRRLPWDAKLLSMSPHMHVRGKAFRYEAELADGTREVLLDVPQYDFNWQSEYRLAEAIDLPAKSRIHAVAHFDNSAENLNNPDPEKTVHWGDQTWDEMMIGYFLIAVPVDTPVAHPESELRTPEEVQSEIERRAQKFFERIDADGDGQLSRDEAPALLKHGFDNADGDHNGTISPHEFAAAVKIYMDSL